MRIFGSIVLNIYKQLEINPVLISAGLDMSPSTIINSRPYGITPPLKQDSLSFPPGMGNPLEIAQSQSGSLSRSITSGN